MDECLLVRDMVTMRFKSLKGKLCLSHSWLELASTYDNIFGQVLHSIKFIFNFFFLSLSQIPLQLKIGYTNYGSTGSYFDGTK